MGGQIYFTSMALVHKLITPRFLFTVSSSEYHGKPVLVDISNLPFHFFECLDRDFGLFFCKFPCYSASISIATVFTLSLLTQVIASAQANALRVRSIK